jgi:hypothetical protein
MGMNDHWKDVSHSHRAPWVERLKGDGLNDLTACSTTDWPPTHDLDPAHHHLRENYASLPTLTHRRRCRRRLAHPHRSLLGWRELCRWPDWERQWGEASRMGGVFWRF